MTLPSTGPISMSQVRAELGRSSGPISLGEAAVRQLAGKPTGAVSMSDLRGKSSYQYQGTLNVQREPIKGEMYGYGPLYGSINPETIPGRGDIMALMQHKDNGNITFALNQHQPTFFTQLLIGGRTLNASSATRIIEGSLTQWLWESMPLSYIRNHWTQTLSVEII